MAAELYKSIQRATCGYFDTRNYSSKEEYKSALEGSTTLYIGNVNTKTKESQILELFSRCGPVQRVIIGVNKATFEPCGFAFVVYAARADALYAIKTLNGTRLNNQPIRTDLDPGFTEGRQYGRGKEGNQVRQDNQKSCLQSQMPLAPGGAAAPIPAAAGSSSLLDFPPVKIPPLVPAQFHPFPQCPPYQTYQPRREVFRGGGRGGWKRHYNERDSGNNSNEYPSKRPRYGNDNDRDERPRHYQRQDYHHYHSHGQGYQDRRDERRGWYRSRSNSRDNSEDDERGHGHNTDEARPRKSNYTTRY